MALDLKLYEEFTLKGFSFGSFVCGYSEDGKIFLLTQTGICILTLKGYLTNVFTEFSFKKEYFEVSDFTPSLNLGLDIENTVYNLPRNNFYEVVLRPELSSRLSVDSLSHITPKPVSANWSPRGIVGKTDCLLAVHTNLYSLEIYVKYINTSGKTEFICIANIAKEITEYLKSTWAPVAALKPVDKLQEFKTRVSIATVTAHCWSHVHAQAEMTDYIIIFAGHMDGGITAWKINGRESNDVAQSKVKCFGKYKTKLQHITSLCWQQTSTFTGALAAGDLNGSVSVINVTRIDNGSELEFKDETLLCEHRNYIKVSQISIREYEGITYLLVVKNSALVIFAINTDGLVFDRMVFSPGDFPITGLVHYEKNTWDVLTLDTTFTQLKLYCKNNELHAEIEKIPLKIDPRKFSTVGVVTSPNRVLFMIVASPAKARFAVRGKKYINLHFFRNMNVDPFRLLMTNTSNSLRDYWDCIDMLRVTSLKEKCFPWVGIDENMNYDKLSLLQLKTLRLIAKVSECVVSVVPIIRHYHIKPYILLHYMVDMKLAVTRMKCLLKLKSNGVELSKFQLCSIDLLNFFLKEMVNKNILAKAQVGEDTINEIIEVMAAANELRYPPMPQCFWCGEKIIGSSCLPPHSDSRCAISLMPILFTPAYQCPFCKCILHKEIEKEIAVIYCPYCDVPMEPSYHGKKFEKFTEENKTQVEHVNDSERQITNLDAALPASPPNVISSSCCDDCLKDHLSPEELSEDAVENIMTVSDGESDDGENEIIDLYFRTCTKINNELTT